MKTSTFTRSAFVPLPLDEVFAFFSDARNLEKLTPPHLGFRIVGDPPEEIRAGLRISYALRVKGLPLRWVSEISEWDPPHRFVDIQLKGPYRSWHHEHAFEEVEGGTLVKDSIEYAVWGGSLIDRLLVRPDIERIFAYRKEALERELGVESRPTVPA